MLRHGALAAATLMCFSADALQRTEKAALADLRFYELAELDVDGNPARRHDVAGLLLQAARVGQQVRCDVEEASLIKAAASFKGLSFTGGAECSHFELEYDWFQRVATDRGRPGDVDYVRLYRKTYPESERFAFEEHVSDVGDCAHYGSGRISELYLEWRALSAKYPGVHAQETRAIMNDLMAFLAPEHQSCACNESIGGIVSELEDFLKAVPGAPESGRVRQELQSLKSDPDAADLEHWKLECVPG